MVTFDSVLNTIIPPAVVIIFGFILLRAMKEPLGDLWTFLSKIIGGIRDMGNKDEEEDGQFAFNKPKYIDYE